MKTEFIALSWSGLFCLISAVVIAIGTIGTHEWIALLLVACLLAYAREDARQPIALGKWERRRFVWRRIERSESEE